MLNFLAFDLGAESGRAMLGRLDNGKLALEELHRFLNQPVRLPDGLYWDSFRLFHDIREGLRIAGRERKLKLEGVAVDTWGVDFGMIDALGELVANPRHYRDPRNNGAIESANALVPKAEVFRHTGLQFMQFNSLYQLHAIRRSGAPGLDIASRLLFMPDLLSYWLSGVAKNELTITSTAQFYNPAEKRWATELFEKLDIPTRILGDIVQPGARLGPLTDELGETYELAGTPVYATASHDTASAVAAVPATGDEPWCYISSGTWSLMGVELDQPIINDKVFELTLTNEIGAEGKIRFLKNIAGLWLLQECRRQWLLEGNEHSYADLAAMSAKAPAFHAVIRPDYFLEPGRMPSRIDEYCRQTGQKPPESVASYVRTILESLALRYRQVLESLEAITGNRIATIHIVGGGSKNSALNQLVADATGRTVVAGPTEATAAGNVLVQAMGAGAVKDLREVRAIVRNSFPMESFTPNESAAPEWDRAYDRFQRLPL
jgi:sugar (pentulose or hexulose) kinase